MLVETQIIFLLLFNLFLIQIINQKYLKNIINLFLTIFLCLQIISYYLTNELIDYRFFIHTNISSIKSYIFQYELETFFLIFLGFLIFNFQSKFKKFKFKKNKNNYSILLILFLILSFNSNTMFRQLYEIVTVYNNGLLYKFTTDSKQKNLDYESFLTETSLNKTIKKSNVIDGKLGNNIIVINLESLDTGFLFGTPQLTKNLNILINELNFTTVKPIDGCNWTAGSMFCLMTGIPGYFPYEKNRIFQGVDSVNVINLGYILSKNGYKNLDYFVGESKFSGLGDLMRAMGFKIYDSYKLKDKIKVYPETFGYHDLDLFNELKKKILEYKKKGDSFAIFASTINTHLSGIVDERFIKNNELSKIEQSVVYLDYLIDDFIKFLKKEGLFEQVNLVLVTDHLYPNNKSLGKMSAKLNSVDRSLFILSNQNKKYKKNISQLDLSKTILDLSDVRHNYSFFSDLNNSSEIDKILKNKKFYISEFNKKNINFDDSSKTYQISIMNNNLKIKQNDNLIYQSKMKYSEPSYINLIFDKNFIFKTKDNIPDLDEHREKIIKEFS